MANLQSKDTKKFKSSRLVGDKLLGATTNRVDRVKTIISHSPSASDEVDKSRPQSIKAVIGRNRSSYNVIG